MKIKKGKRKSTKLQTCKGEKWGGGECKPWKRWENLRKVKRVCEGVRRDSRNNQVTRELSFSKTWAHLCSVS